MKWQNPNAIPTELMLQSSTEYFTLENENILFTFRMVENQLQLAAFFEGKEYVFNRKLG